MLGKREPTTYGHHTLADIVDGLQQQAQSQQVNLRHFQSSAEHALIDCIHESVDNTDVIIINPGAFTHTSIALRDALLSVAIPFIEIHLSNVHAREPFRHHSFLSDVAAGVIVGLGAFGYELALSAAINLAKSNNTETEHGH